MNNLARHTPGLVPSIVADAHRVTYDSGWVVLRQWRAETNSPSPGPFVALTTRQWLCLRTSTALWRKHTAPPSRFTLTSHQLEQTVLVLGDGPRLAPDLGARR